VAGATGYALRVRTLRARGRRLRRRQPLWFAIGVAVVAGALLTPIDRIGEQDLFWVHMVQHLMVGDIGPLFVVLGLSGAILRPLLAAPGIGRLRVLAHPLVALPLWAANLFGWHLAGPYQDALRHDALHALEHVSFFTTGALMWAAVIQPLPGPRWFGTGWRALYVLVVRVLGAVLASVFIWSDRVFYPWYGSLHDQQAGGLIMFTEGGIVTLVAFGLLFLGWIEEGQD
jgi:putative membrane protein